MTVHLSGYRYLEVVPGRRGGKPVVKGTRVTVEDIVESLAAGWSVDEVAEQFNIPRDAVLEALRYVAELLRRTNVIVTEEAISG